MKNRDCCSKYEEMRLKDSRWKKQRRLGNEKLVKITKVRLKQNSLDFCVVTITKTLLLADGWHRDCSWYFQMCHLLRLCAFFCKSIWLLSSSCRSLLTSWRTELLFWPFFFPLFWLSIYIWNSRPNFAILPYNI